MTTSTTPDLAPAVPIVTVHGGDLVRVHRPAAGHTFTFPVGAWSSSTAPENDPEILASCLRGALADAFRAGKEEGRAEPRPSLLARKIAEADARKIAEADAK